MSVQINTIMYSELADLGPLIVKRECATTGIDPQNITARNLPTLSKALSEVMSTFGLDKARRVYHMINQLTDLDKIVNSERNLDEKVDGLLNLGDFAHFAGEFDKALGYYGKVLALDGDKQQLAAAHCRVGIVRNSKNEPRKALESFAVALRLVRAAKGRHLEAMVHRGMGFSYWRLADYSMTQRNYKRAMSIADRHGKPDLKAVLHIDLGLLYENKGSYRRAMTHLQTAINLLSGSSDIQMIFHVTRAYNSMGEVLKHYEDFDAAISCYNKCYDIAKSIDNEVMMGYALSNAAECYAKMGQLETAKVYADRTLDIFVKRGDKYMIGGVYLTYGIIFSKQGNRKLADESFNEAISLMMELGYPYEIGTHKYERARALREMGHYKEAYSGFRETLKHFEGIGSAWYISQIRREMDYLQRKMRNVPG